MKKIIFGIVLLLGLGIVAPIASVHAAEMTQPVTSQVSPGDTATMKLQLEALQVKLKELQGQAASKSAQLKPQPVAINEKDAAALKQGLQALSGVLTQMQSIVQKKGLAPAQKQAIIKGLGGMSTYLVAINTAIGGGTPTSVAAKPVKLAPTAPVVRNEPVQIAGEATNLLQSPVVSFEEDSEAASVGTTLNLRDLPWSAIATIAAIAILAVWFVRTREEDKLGKLARTQ
jgi:hypothetical protein